MIASLDDRATVVRTARGDVQVARDGTGPPVLAIHGSPGGFDLGLAYYRHLRDGGCEIIAPSRPGYLRTPLDSGRHPEDQADLCAALLDALDIQRATIAGFSSGGPCAAQFAARHADRTTALLLDAAILLPFELPPNALERSSLATGGVVWLHHQIATRRPGALTPLVVRACSDGLSRDQRRAAARWIRSNPSRLQRLSEAWASIAPREYRERGLRNDSANEAGLAPLPFGDITAPTLIAHGSGDGIVPVVHATAAANRIAGAELILVEKGHHILALSRGYEPVARRQLELAHG